MDVTLEQFTNSELNRASASLKKIINKELARFKLGKPYEQRQAQCLAVILLAGQLEIFNEFKRRMMDGKTLEQQEMLANIFEEAWGEC